MAGNAVIRVTRHGFAMAFCIQPANEGLGIQPWCHRLGMYRVNVINLEKIIPQGFPVAVHTNGLHRFQLEFFQRKTFKLFGKGTQISQQRFRVVPKVEKDKASPDLTVNRYEATGGFVQSSEIVIFGNRHERTIQMVTPCMVGADQMALFTTRFCYQRRATMPAGIVKSPNLILCIPADNNG